MRRNIYRLAVAFIGDRVVNNNNIIFCSNKITITFIQIA